MIDVLLTFTGFNDPYAVGLVGHEEQPGPILSLVQTRQFGKICLFSTPNTEKNTGATKESLRSLYPAIEIEVRSIELDDPTDYSAILNGLRTHLFEILSRARRATYYVSVASGTPQMHACWVILVANGEFPAHILHVRPPRFVTKDRPVVSEVDLAPLGISDAEARFFEPSAPLRPSTEIPSEIEEEFEVCRVARAPLMARPKKVAVDWETVGRELGIVGDHPAMRKALEVGATLASSTAPILILGETGTGKELLARFIHRLSGRNRDRFVPLNCATIPKELFESVLFGHKKGSFTGAVTDQTGKFDQAHRGTLFLDEIGELPMQAQAKLLRVLDDRLVEPLGARNAHKVDVRIIAATNSDLGKARLKGKFREDLYYRLSCGEIRLPPLRERQSDVPKIALYVLERVNGSLRSPKRLAPGALTRLQNHSWPGNVRDLENVIERSVRLAQGDVLEADDLLISEDTKPDDPFSALPHPYVGFSLPKYVASVRKQLVLRALESANGNMSMAAKLLGISPQAVHKFLEKKSS